MRCSIPESTVLLATMVVVGCLLLLDGVYAPKDVAERARLRTKAYRRSSEDGNLRVFNTGDTTGFLAQRLALGDGQPQAPQPAPSGQTVPSRATQAGAEKKLIFQIRILRKEGHREGDPEARVTSQQNIDATEHAADSLESWAQVLLKEKAPLAKTFTISYFSK